MSALTIGSLFSGIGGLELGLERGIGNGAHTIWQVEQSDYCRAVLAKHWPDAIRYDDVRTVGRSTLAPVEVICGGFPCQDVSNAGRRAGIVDGSRSGLWYEYARIIRELRPRYVVVENVAALLSLGLDAVLGELAESGYDAEWDCVPASSVGAPHQRDRVFVLAYPESDRRAQRGTRDHRRNVDSASRINVRAQSRGSCAGERTPNDVAHSEGQRVVGGRSWTERAGRPRIDGGGVVPTASAFHIGWSVEPNVGRVAHGVRSRVDRLRALGNAVVPQVAEVVGRLIAAREAERAVA